MKIVRFATGNKTKYGVLEKEKIRSLRGSPFTQFKGPGSKFTFSGESYKLKDVNLLAPCTPSKIVAIGVNYLAHREESKRPQPPAPVMFLKPSTAIIGPGAEIVMPYLNGLVEFEGELAVVIGKLAKDVSEEAAKSVVLGYTCLNDVSERVAQRGDGQWTRGKGFDTFAPMGPWIETDVNADDTLLETYLNGERRQSSSTALLINGLNKLIHDVSAAMTLLPGDVIATGTPAGVGQMNVGDTVEVRIQGIGSLVNKVVYHQKP